MFRHSIRKLSAFLLVLTLWLSATALLPISATAQEKSGKNSSKKQQSGKTAKKEDKSNTQKPAQQTTANKALSEKEDPALIGKRNVNAGSDKFFGWLGGSREREMAIGRQLALEVEQQAKLV